MTALPPSTSPSTLPNSGAASPAVSELLSAAAAATPQPTAAQQTVLDRIAAQRQRIAAQQARERYVLTGDETSSGAAGARIDAAAPLAQRVLTFARLHPVATSVGLAAAVWMGPRKLLRVASVVLPLWSKFSRKR